MFGASRGRNKTLASAVATVLLLAMLLPFIGMPVLAHEPKKDGGHNDGRDEGQVNYERTDGNFYIHSSGQGNASHEDLDLKIDTNDGLMARLTLRYNDDRVTARMSITVEFKCLVGLKEGETAGKVHCGNNDTARSTLPFSKMTFKEPYYSNYTEDDETVHKVDVTSKDGRFQLKVELTGDFFESNGTSQPDPVKMHIKVHDFEFEKGDKKLGLDMEVRSNLLITVKKDLIGHDGTGDDIVEKRDPSEPKDEELGGTFLAVNDLATVDGDSKDVMTVASTTADGGMLVSVAYPRGETIQQDMEMAIQPRPITLRGDAALYSAGIGVVVAIFVLTDKRILSRLARLGK